MTEYSPRDLSRLAATLYRDGPWLMRLLQRWRPYICPFHELIEAVPRRSYVFDIGCGGGLFLAVLAGTGRISGGLGVDADGSAVTVANAMVRRLPQDNGIQFQRLDVRESLPDGPFDAVTMIDVLHHVTPALQADVIRAAADRVAPGGILIFKDIARRPIWKSLANRMHDLVLSREWIHYAPIDDVRRWAEQQNLVVREHRAIDILWYRHEMMILARPAAPD